jgi:gas vesicle protein
MKDNRIAILLTGMGVGAAAGLLFARYSGVELRKQITGRAGEAKAFLRNQTEVLVDRVGKAADEVEHHFAKGKDVVRDLNNKAKDIMEDASSVTTAATNEFVDKSRAVASKAGKVIEKQGERLQNI